MLELQIQLHKIANDDMFDDNTIKIWYWDYPGGPTYRVNITKGGMIGKKYSMPGFPVHHQLPDLAQTHVHRVSDAIQPSHPLLTPSPPAFSHSQHQGLFK